MGQTDAAGVARADREQTLWHSGQGRVGGDAICTSRVRSRKSVQTFAGRMPCYCTALSLFDCVRVAAVSNTVIGKPTQPIRRPTRRPGRGQCALFLP